MWASNGLDPEFVFIPDLEIRAADIKEQVAQGIKIGFSVPGEVLIARSQGVPVKIVSGHLGELLGRI